MIIRPRYRLRFRFEKAIDHQRLPFVRRPARAARCLSINNVASSVRRDANAVRKMDSASIRNPVRIDRTMSSLQLQTARATMSSRV